MEHHGGNCIEALYFVVVADGGSNHRPILACMDPDQPVNLRMRAFRFLSSWLTNHDFDCNVHEDRNKVNETNH